jgi:hypothetical protein
MTRERIQQSVEFRFLRIPAGWELKENPQGAWITEPHVRQGKHGQPTELDGWELRRQFLLLKDGKLNAMVRFLEAVGLWQILPDPHFSLDRGVGPDDPFAQLKKPERFLWGYFGSRLFQGWALPVECDQLRRTALQIDGWLRNAPDGNAPELREKFGPPPAARSRIWWQKLQRDSDLRRAKHEANPAIRRFYAELKAKFGYVPSRNRASESERKDVASFLFALQTQTVNELPMHIEWRQGEFERDDGTIVKGDVPHAVVETITGREMLTATIHLDLIRGARFQICKRKNCSIPFPVLTKHGRGYCRPACGHADHERMRRDRIREEKPNAKKR